jgi:hypothetical protein
MIAEAHTSFPMYPILNPYTSLSGNIMAIAPSIMHRTDLAMYDLKQFLQTAIKEK